MISSFKYDIQNWITNLTTPYGITTFENVTTSDNWSNTTYGSYTLVRALRVVDAAGGTNVYMLRQDSGFVKVDENDPLPFIYHDDFNYGTVMPNAPDSSSFPGASYLNYANSFHWGPKQASGLPADIWTYTPSDLLKARMCHWLRGEIPGKLSQTLEMEQAPSPDGIMRGQTIWYDYAACQQTAIGASGQPCLIAKRLPDGTTQFVAYQRDQWAHATNVVDTYSAGYGETPGTRTNVYGYDGNGINLVQQISAQGETTGYAYNSHNQVMFVTNAINEVTAYTYDQNGRRTGVTQPSGLITTNIYYNSGSAIHFLQSTIDLPINRTNSYTYSNNLVYSHTDERGLATTNTWDALQRIRRIDDVNGFITNSYDKLDLVKIVDRMGFTNAYGYDAVRRKIAQTNAVGAVTIYNYCPCGALESIQDAAGNFTSFEYDNAGNLLLATYWDGEIVNYSVTNNYDLLGRITNTIDSAGVGMTNWYNNQGLRYAAENAAGQVYFNEYDSDDHVTNSVNANKVSIKMTYDALGRLLTRNYPDGGVEGFGYTFGIAGPTSYTNQIGKVTYYGYDAARRKIAETNALNYTTLFTYNAAGDLLTLTDGKNQNTTWKYDPFGRVTNKLDNLATNLFVYKYDPDNRLTNRWSAAKASTTYKYDAVGNLTNVVYPVSPQIKLAYDKLSRLTNMVDGIGTTTYGYDAVAQLWNEGGLWPNDTVSYTYANRLRMSLSLASAPWIQRYGYDAARRLTSIISPAGEFDYAYDPAQLQRVVALTLANAAVITNQYDSVARLTLTELMNSSGSDVDSYSYSYNAANQRTNVVRTAGDYVNYTYDNIGELQTAVGKEAGGVTNRWQEQFGYAYDAAGNLNYRTNHALLQRFNINSLNELTTVTNGGRLTVAGGTIRPVTNVTVNTSNAVVYADVTFASTNQPWVNGNNTYTAIAKDIWGQRATNTVTVNLQGTNSYTYDLNGNLLSDGWRGFDYDDENQLVRVTVTNSWKSEFTYDGKMRRRILKEFTWSGSSWTQTNEVRFIYDGNLVVLERNASDQPLVEYTRGNDLSGTLQGAGGIGGLLARSQDSLPGTPFYAVHSYYHADGNGNVTMLIDASQLVMAKYLYDPYGNTLAQSGLLADANTYRFSSKEWNANSGLYYYLYRLCDPNLQRWLNRDPIGEFGGINLYGFVANCPLMRVDSNGRKWISTGKPPPPDTPTVVCKGGKPVPYVPHYSGPELNELTGGDPAQINSYFCAQKCVRKHELSHVQDILAQNPDICVGVLDGTTIGNNDPNTELLNSEQKAHQVEADCLKQCEKTCPGKAVDNQIKNNDQWIKDHQYE